MAEIRSSQHKLGVLGGMGPQATIGFYQFIVDRTQASCDQDHLPTLILSDSQIPDRTGAILSGNTEPAFQHLLKDAKLLEDSGCTAIVIPCNTAHYFVDRLQQELKIPIIHMVRETVGRLARAGKKRTCILGTDGTIQTGLYQKECAAVGLEALCPPADIQKLIMSIIYDEIKAGKRGSWDKFQKIDQALSAMGCDCAILACTELSVFRTQYDLPGYYVDAMEVLAEEAVVRCGKQFKKI